PRGCALRRRARRAGRRDPRCARGRRRRPRGPPATPPAPCARRQNEGRPSAKGRSARDKPSPASITLPMIEGLWAAALLVTTSLWAWNRVRYGQLKRLLRALPASTVFELREGAV